MKHEKDRVLANLSLGDPNRLIFFQNLLKFLGADIGLDYETSLISQSNQRRLTNKSHKSKLKPISFNFNIFQNCNSMMKRTNSSVGKLPNNNSLNDTHFSLIRGSKSNFATSKSKVSPNFPVSGYR